MSKKKVHLNIENPGWQDACNKNTLHVRSQGGTLDISKVTCKSCKKTKYYQEQVQKMESERKASSEELGYEVEHFTKHQLCPYELGKSGSWINSLNCRRCDYNECFSENKTDVKCSFKAKNKPKTQLEKDTEKYNLSDEQVEILSKVDYEVVHTSLGICRDCLFRSGSKNCYHTGSKINCGEPDDINNDGYNIIFKQTHKTQTSLNGSIEKEEAEKGIEEPFGETKQQSEHYQKENDHDLETIEKMQIISDIFEEQDRTFTAMEGYTLMNQYKYLDRMGKKDEPKKEGYKICDYYERNKNEKWLHEVNNLNK